MEEKNQGKKAFDAQTIIIVVSILLAAVIIGGAIFVSGKKGADTGTTGQVSGSGLEIGESAVIGNPDAPVTIVEFLDFQCPACEAFYSQIEKTVREKYIDTGKAKMVFKTLTFIDSFDKYANPLESLSSAKAAECAKEQGKFILMHDAIFDAELKESSTGVNPENSGNLTDAFLKQAAQEIGLDMQAYDTCYSSDRLDTILNVYNNDANTALNGQVSTPSVFIDGKKLSNPFDIAQFESRIK